MKKRVTIYDIAKAMNVAPATVSRALTNSSGISEEMRKKIIVTAQSMNYRPNLVASNLRTGGSKAIGVVVPKINNQFFSNVIAGIDEIAFQHKYHLLICQTDELYEKEVESIHTLIRQNVACIIISLTKSTNQSDHLKEVLEHNIPLIQFDRVDSSLDCIKVINDNATATVDMVRHLKGQRYESIAYLAGPLSVGIFKERFDAFKKALHEFGLPYYKELVTYDCINRPQAKDATLRLLTSEKKPDAIIASTDRAALGVLDAAKEMGIRVPEELGICGYSNEDYSELTTPQITSVNQFSAYMGKKVAEFFFDSQSLDKKNFNQLLVIPSELIQRESSTRYHE